jgi:hypothetical protein
MAKRPLVLLKILPALAWLALAGPSFAEDGAASNDGRAQASAPVDTEAEGRPSEGERAAEPEQAERKPLNRYDTDGDGQLSARERSAARKERMQRRAELLEKYDSNGDGRLSAAEQAAARADGAGRSPGSAGTVSGQSSE